VNGQENGRIGRANGRENSRTIGITGGIGAGKSAATDYLREKGYLVIDADELAREAARPGEPALARIKEAFGDAVLTPDGELNRAALARLVFAEGDLLLTLNEIFHADIKRRILSLTEGREGAFFISAPLLFETRAEGMCDEVWLVTADEALRLSRTMTRDGLTEADVRARMQKQMPESEKREKADVVIENTGSKEELRAKLDALLLALTSGTRA
jgi:dephospho-CoA kinase